MVLDQTVGDASVTLGMTHEGCFQTMLEAALAAYPLAHVWVKTHPDVIAGKKRDYLADYAAGRGVRGMAVDCTPLSLLAEQCGQNERNRRFHACVGFRCQCAINSLWS